MKPFLLFLLGFLPLYLSAQTDTSGQHRLIKGLVDYRNELIARNPEGFKQLYLLDTLWKVENKEELIELLSGVAYISNIYGASAAEIVSATKLLGMDSLPFKHLLTTEIIQAAIENDDLAFLIGDQILKPKPPFALDPNNSFFEEIAYYDIENGMSVAEIGAGTGMFSLLLGLAYDSLTIYMNDIALNSMIFAYDRVNRCKSIRKSNKYIAVEGKKKSTKLEDYQVDRVIVRNAFHHFSNKEKMLASIKLSMTPSTELCLFEPDKSSEGPGTCPMAMKADALKKVLTDNGLQIIEEHRVEKWGWVLIRCKLMP